jgi:hypothetical protein
VGDKIQELPLLIISALLLPFQPLPSLSADFTFSQLFNSDAIKKEEVKG